MTLAIRADRLGKRYRLGDRESYGALRDALAGLLRNPLGLLSEEYDPTRRRLIGNFPQGFSHLALIASAQILDECLGAPKGRLAPGGRDLRQQPSQPTA